MEELEQIVLTPLINLGGVDFMPVVTLGHVLVFSVTVLGGLVAVGKMMGVVRSTERQVSQLQRDLAALRMQLSTLSTVLLNNHLRWGAPLDDRDDEPEDD